MSLHGSHRRRDGGSQPNAVESEAQIVGAILVHPKLVSSVELPVDELYDPALRAVYAAILGCEREAKPIDAVTVEAEMRSSQTFDQLRSRGGAEYLTTLRARVVTVESIDYHVQLVREKAALRRLARFGIELYEAAAAAGGSSVEMIGTYVARLQEEARFTASSRALPPTAAEVLRSDSFTAAQRTYPTSFPALDEKIGGGLKARQLSVVAPPSGSAKTGFASKLALDWAEQPSRYCGVVPRSTTRSSPRAWQRSPFTSANCAPRPTIFCPCASNPRPPPAMSTTFRCSS